jgi:hypothetical protein
MTNTHGEELKAIAHNLLTCYRDRVRPFLSEHKVAFTDALDQRASLLELAMRRKREVSVGFVGAAQVGKSTLINAVLERHALPAGGIGPLTAQATRVAYAPENAFEVTYHTRRRLHQLAFAVAAHLRRTGALSAEGGANEGDIGVSSEDASEVIRDLLEDVHSEVDDDGEGRTRADRKVNYMLAQARRMLCDETVEPSAVDERLIVDGLRAVLGQAQLFPDVDLNDFGGRIATLREYLGKTERLSETAGGRREFRRELDIRAAGWLAPLVSQLRVYLSSSIVDNMTLVDLPGIGVFGDAAAHVAEEFVRREADALVLVLRNDGMGVDLVKLLEDTGVITKLLFGGDSAGNSIYVAVAITCLDNVAREHYQRAARDAAEFDEPAPDRHAIFRKLAEQMQDKVRHQIAEALRRSSAFDELDEAQRARREAVVRQLCQSMDVVCVAGPDYMSLMRNMPDMCFLKEPGVTGVPTFREALLDLATSARSHWESEVISAGGDLRSTVVGQLEALAAAYQAGRGKAAVEWETFAADLREVAGTLSRDMHTFHGEVLACLSKELPARIGEMCRHAEKTALKKLVSLRRKGAKLPWASLNAALRRKGIWDRQGIDYPGVLTRALVDSVASDWEPVVVKGVRELVKELARRDLQLVEKLCNRASDHDSRIVSEAQIETQKAFLRSSADNCVKWTRERLDELRGEVYDELYQAVLGEIEGACTAAIAARANRGSGARDRILEQFESGGHDAIEVSGKKAEAILKRKYDQLRRELHEGYLADHHDPVTAALDALTQEELLRARRSDAQRRRRVLERATELLADMRQFSPDNE